MTLRMTRLSGCCLTLLIFLNGSAMNANAEIRHSTLAAKTGVQEAEANIAKALEGSTMKTAQGEVSLPAVERYVRRLETGEVPPAIKVDEDVIVDGNHGYVAGRLVGTEPPVTPGTLSTGQAGQVRPIQQTVVKPEDWGNH